MIPFGLQIDLEPVGKVHVIIDLAGSSSEGKKTVVCPLTVNVMT